VARALATVGLTERAGDRLSELSGGQQQRVLLARALAGRPDLLVLDEPTAGVDLTSQAALTETLSELVRQRTALIVVLHDVGWLAGLLDRGVVLREGRIAYDGPLGELSQPVDHRHHPEVGEPGWLNGAIER
jgi:zinc transport system ATP-binding protein